MNYLIKIFREKNLITSRQDCEINIRSESKVVDDLRFRIHLTEFYYHRQVSNLLLYTDK